MNWNYGRYEQDYREHTGIDFNIGEEIVDSSSGLVTQTIDSYANVRNDKAGYGNRVVITGNMVYMYCHMVNGSGVAVFENDFLVAGKYLGLKGTSGYSTGPHLHYEVRVIGKAHTDPNNYLPENTKCDYGVGTVSEVGPRLPTN